MGFSNKFTYSSLVSKVESYVQYFTNDLTVLLHLMLVLLDESKTKFIQTFSQCHMQGTMSPAAMQFKG